MTVSLAAPPSASPLAERLASALHWTCRADEACTDVDGALGVARTEAVVIVPAGVDVSGADWARCVAAVHDGTPAASGAVLVAERIAAAVGAQVIVVHAAERDPHAEPGSLPAPRVADHDAYDWEDWRSEFVRRFGGAHPPSALRLEVVSGPPAESIVNALGRGRVDLVVATWKGDAAPGRCQVLRALAHHSPAPVLVLLEGNDAGPAPAGTG